MIHLHVEPATPPVRWKDFIAQKPQRSIALDGYVLEGPRFNPRGPWANFNHHDGVSRLETRATCAQVLIALRQGLTHAFHNDSGCFEANVFVNDCDEDVSLSVALLRNNSLATSVMNPLINRLVFMEDMLDSTTGAYPFPRDLESLREVMWVFYPYHCFRASGRIDYRVKEEFLLVIDEVEQRVLAYAAGKAKTIELDMRYKLRTTHARTAGWTWDIVEEIGAHARLAMFGDGTKAFVSVHERPDGTRRFTIGRASQFIHFPVAKFCVRLNEAEGRTDGDLWGGGDFVIGSPRVHGSKLTIDEVNDIISKTM